MTHTERNPRRTPASEDGLPVDDPEAPLTELLGRACGGERAPEELRARLRARLRAAGPPAPGTRPRADQ